MKGSLGVSLVNALHVSSCGFHFASLGAAANDESAV